MFHGSDVCLYRDYIGCYLSSRRVGLIYAAPVKKMLQKASHDNQLLEELQVVRPDRSDLPVQMHDSSITTDFVSNLGLLCTMCGFFLVIFFKFQTWIVKNAMGICIV